MMSEDTRYILDLMLEDKDTLAKNHILLESEKDRIMQFLEGEVTLMNYLLKFEEYLDDHDVYLFDGWKDVEVVKSPSVDKFWVTVYLKLTKNTDLRGIKRILNNDENQNQVKKKTGKDGSVYLKVKVLKRLLDDIEIANKKRAEELAMEQLEDKK